MAQHAWAVSEAQPQQGSVSLRILTRALYIALLLAAPLLPQLGNSVWTYPAVTHAWVLLPLGGLFVLPLLDTRGLWRICHLDLLVLLSFGVSLAAWHRSSFLAMAFIYAPLAYLFVRMVRIARVGASSHSTVTVSPVSGSVPVSWLLAGILVLLAVHVHWTLGGDASTDVGPASVLGALKLLHGHSVYGLDRAQVANLGYDPHYDAYGPVVYESYIPFAALAGAHAARLAALFFDLLSAGLLFLLGRRLRGPRVGVRLAYAWLAFPFTLYTGALGANDALVAAALLGTLLAAGSPGRRGVLAALAGLTKLSPLALLPALIAHAPRPNTNANATRIAFCAGFGLSAAVLLAPMLLESGLSDFLARTFGYQLSRPPGFTIWEQLDVARLGHFAWLKPASAVAHGLLIALTAAFALTLAWVRKREDVAGLAAACAAVLVALQACSGYYSYTYILWLAPLVLVAVLLSGEERSHASARTREQSGPHHPAQETTVSALGRLVSTS